jgi:hypothetical protein
VASFVYLSSWMLVPNHLIYRLSSSFVFFSCWRCCFFFFWKGKYYSRRKLQEAITAERRRNTTMVPHIYGSNSYWLVYFTVFLHDFSIRIGLDMITRGVYSILLYKCLTILHLSVTTTAEFVLYYLNVKGCLWSFYVST